MLWKSVKSFAFSAGIKERKKTMNVLDCAMKMEKEARVYYEKLADTASIPEMKNLFSLLAESEKEHYDALVKIKTNADYDAPFTDLPELACLFKPLLSKRDLVAELIKQPDAYLDIVTEEEKGVGFYEDLAAHTKDVKDCKILLKIANEERKHLSIVKNIYSFVESPKYFIASAGFSNNEGL
jgi:rubrerythrin